MNIIANVLRQPFHLIPAFTRQICVENDIAASRCPASQTLDLKHESFILTYEPFHFIFVQYLLHLCPSFQVRQEETEQCYMRVIREQVGQRPAQFSSRSLVSIFQMLVYRQQIPFDLYGMDRNHQPAIGFAVPPATLLVHGPHSTITMPPQLQAFPPSLPVSRSRKKIK